MSAVADRTLFDSAFLAKLEQLHLLAKKLARGDRRAERRSRQQGSSLEFADYREYSPGDELRRIDWPAYARLERLFVKLYEQEQDLPVSILVDASASMRWRPEEESAEKATKFDTARRMAAALAYIALANLDSVNVHFFAEGLLRDLGGARGKSQFHRVLDFLREPPAETGPTRLKETMRSLTQRVKRRGMVILLSDFFDPAGWEEPLSLLRHCQFEVQVLQVLHPEELEPRDLGDLRLTESESGTKIDVTANEALLRRYREEVTAFNEGLARFCLQRAIAHASVTCEVPFEDLVLRVLRDGLLLK